jgi:hypothetical protein
MPHRRRRAAALVAIAVASASCVAPASSTQQPTAAQKELVAASASGGGVVVTHEPSTALPDTARWFANTNVMASAAELINRVFAVPTRVDLIAQDCGKANAFYDPARKVVTICHELVAAIAGAFEDHRYLRQLYLYVVLHEIGHALIDVYDLPIVGREEDAADQFAALFFVNVADRDLALVMGVVLAAQFFRRVEQGNQPVFWDNHTFGEARYYALLCLIYGGAPATRSAVASVLPAERADQCESEYAQIRRGWNRLLQGHSRAPNGTTFTE